MSVRLIPEPGCNYSKGPFGADLEDVRLSKHKALPFKLPSEQEMRRFMIRTEKERIAKERVHNKNFVGTPTLRRLIDKLYSDYSLSCKKVQRANKRKKERDA